MAGKGEPRSNRKVALTAASAALAMLGLGFASVPLYRIFCQVTGYGGTTQRADEAKAATVKDSGRTISIRFDANVERNMPWQFKPLQRTDTVSIGARDMALFWAKNDSDKTVTGTASFNVEPEQAARYFNKIQCFCFTEQTLKPGEEVRMPVLYYVDPAILTDPDNKDVQQITLSYTFHVTRVEDAKALDHPRTGS
ncbi:MULTISPECIES: cytochrome c oxidase assembly protein [Sphingomonadaceae]|jgi:cytochrome c oxidase assembly protein subunit 11|uniref:Cytochrome c oxidase assembly protein CtaG n=2 Tax=Novosphingobium TaxID=165696 RepID=A0A031JMZ2_9SPHN|nr:MULTISPECIES: cytochrome c oxidase assembly protein [Sphingomonadaceae]EJU11080.1 cytochrome C oxidase assembly protein [Sphingomonas sp. LH128]EZP74602.1 Cytochrome c oxidase assembly protein CtaG [Novosphingobium resinovorum]MBF7010143.1 cytochrome c oxidase assembly protein [Novosphingobium sp. HR1a]WJM28161.1 cytochrome c oxidase assembly protein [Novosphingobium resinovorum]GLK42222.1 cytochrome c oxidase assembly protein CtaG [Novosphingobium resinovorum]